MLSKLSSLWGATEGRKPCFQREPVGISHPKLQTFNTSSLGPSKRCPTIDFPSLGSGVGGFWGGFTKPSYMHPFRSNALGHEVVTNGFGPSLAEAQIVLCIAYVVGVPFDVQHALGVSIHVVGQGTEHHKRARAEGGFFRVKLHVWQFKRCVLFVSSGLGNKVQ